MIKTITIIALVLLAIITAVFVFALCQAAHLSDKWEAEYYEQLHPGE